LRQLHTFSAISNGGNHLNASGVQQAFKAFSKQCVVIDYQYPHVVFSQWFS